MIINDIIITMKGSIRMKLAHLGDLHIGRRFGEFSLLQDQKHILEEIVDIIKIKNVDAIMISGDIYDKNRPSEVAFSLWDDFLTSLNSLDIHVLITSGNHDSSDRLGIGNRILSKNKIHIASQYQGELKKVVLNDKFGPLNIYMLPFIKPVFVRNFHDDFNGTTTNSAVDYILQKTKIDVDQRNILMSHQFVVGSGVEPILSESEVTPSVGGSDAVDTSLFKDFDYVALGHIHRPQKMGKETIRYAGSPLKYSFSETNDTKSMPILNYKNELKIKYIELKPLRDVRVIKGPLEELIKTGEKAASDDIIHAIITDDLNHYNPISRLRKVYPNIITLEIDNATTQNKEELKRAENILKKDKMALIAGFFKQQNKRDLKVVEKEYLKSVIERIENK